MGEVNHNNRAFDDLVAEMKRDYPSEMALAGERAAGWADGVKHGAAQIDTLRAENAELSAELEETLIDWGGVRLELAQAKAEIAALVAALIEAQKIINHQGWSANEQTAYDAIDAALAKKEFSESEVKNVQPAP